MQVVPDVSLTSHLADPASNVRAFLDRACPLWHFRHWARPAGIAYPKVFDRIYTIAPLERIAWGTVGSALNYRIGIYFTAPGLETSLAYRGAQLLSGTGISASRRGGRMNVLHPRLVRDFFSAFQCELIRAAGPGKRLDGPDERLIARYCFVLAMFEAVARGAQPPEAFLALGSKPTVQDLLDVPYQLEVADLWKLSWAFHEVSKEMFTDKAVFNPIFDGSADVGGADADLLLGDCLVEIKASVPGKVERSWLRQLTGYVLLDYSDAFKIRRVALYLARQAIWLTWPLTKLLPAVAQGKASSEATCQRPTLEDVLLAEAPNVANDLGPPLDLAKLAALRRDFRQTCLTFSLSPSASPGS